MVNDLFSVAGKVALVTGAGSGLGERFAKVLAERGAKVVCVARRIENLEKVAGEIAAAGGAALAVAGDVSDRASVEAAFDAAEKAFGVVDVLVNCAGIQARLTPWKWKMNNLLPQSISMSTDCGAQHKFARSVWLKPISRVPLSISLLFSVLLPEPVWPTTVLPKRQCCI